MKLTKTQGEIKEYVLELECPCYANDTLEKKWKWVLNKVVSDLMGRTPIWLAPDLPGVSGDMYIIGYKFYSKQNVKLKDIERVEKVDWEMHDLERRVIELERTMPKPGEIIAVPHDISRYDQGSKRWWNQ